MDSDFIEESRFSTHSANESRVLHVLSDFVKASVDIESDIQRCLRKIGLSPGGGELSLINKDDYLPSLEDANERRSQHELTLDLCEDGPELVNPSFISSFNLTKDTSVTFGSSAEDDVVLGARRRLRAAVERILRLLTQLIELNQGHDIQAILRRNDELVTELNGEINRREQLAQRLILIEHTAKELESRNGYLEKKLVHYVDMESELDLLRKRFDQYELEQVTWLAEKEKLRNEKVSFANGLPSLQQTLSPYTNTSDESCCTTIDEEPVSYESDGSGGLLQETERLGADIRSLQQEKSDLLKKMQQLECNTENCLNEKDGLLDAKRQEEEDLRAQLESSERKLSSLQKFVHEQALERETERDEFTREVKKLQNMVKEREKMEKKLRDDLESLEHQLNVVTEDKLSMEKKNVSLEKQLAEANQNIGELRQILLQAEKESEKCSAIEKELVYRCNELEEALLNQVKLTEQIQQDQVNNNNMLKSSLISNISAGADKIKLLLGVDENEPNSIDFQDTNNESTDISSIECSYADAQLLEEKLQMLNVYIDRLVSVITKLSQEKDDLSNEKSNFQAKMREILKEKDKLETDLREASRTVDLLQEELNDKHLQLSALKTRLDGTSCLDINQLKSSINEYKRQLTAEQEKNEHMIQQINQFQTVVDEKNSRISQLVNELNTLEAEKAALESEAEELMKDKQFLLDERCKLEKRLEEAALVTEINAGLARAEQEENNETNDVIPQLMQMVIRDKNEEIHALNNQLKVIEDRLSAIIPSKDDNINVILEELINSYITLKKEREELRVNMKSPCMVSQYQSLPSSPCRPFYNEDMSPDQFPLNAKLLEMEKEKRRNLERELREFEIKCDKMYFAVNNLREENDILKHEIENLREEKLMERTSNGHAMSEKDSDFTEEDSLEDALLKIHQQSVELLRLSETHKQNKDSVIRQLIDTLPHILSDEGENEKSLVNDDEMRKVFVQNFPCKDLGSLLLEKLIQIHGIYKEAKERIKYYLSQNETISCQLVAVEDALIQAQTKLDLYQKKYEKVKRKLKERNNGFTDVPYHQNNKKLASDHAEIYHQYRRCLSHKNSLIYQKKYLLNVLGGYKLTEKATLSLLANLNVTSEETNIPITGRIRFKSVVLVIMAINRMNFIRRKHSSSPHKKIDSLFTSHIQPKLTVPITSTLRLSSNASTELMAKIRASTKSETNATIEEFVTRLQRLHHTLGLNYESRSNSAGDISSPDN